MALSPMDIAVELHERAPFYRACIEHHLELDGMTCPRGHRSKVAYARPGRGVPPVEEDAWEVWWEPISGPARLVATCLEGAFKPVRWEPWFLALFETRSVAGRTEDGFTQVIASGHLPMRKRESR